MQNKNEKARITATPTKDKKYILVPNTKCGLFQIGEDIRKYLHLKHECYHCDGYCGLPDYVFYDFSQFGMCVYTKGENHVIVNYITCQKKCIWEGKNIIGMLIKDFLKTYNLHPIPPEGEQSFVYDRLHRYTQRVYDFEEDVGLQVWTWRKRIITVIVSCYPQD